MVGPKISIYLLPLSMVISIGFVAYIRISAGLQSHTLTKDDYVWLENALLFLRPYWWSDREDGKMLMDAFLHTQTLAKKE